MKANSEIPLISKNVFMRILSLSDAKLLLTGARHVYEPSLLYELPRDLRFEAAFADFERYARSNAFKGKWAFGRTLLWWLLPGLSLQSMGYVAGALLLLRANDALDLVLPALRAPNARFWAVLYPTAVFLALSTVRALINAHSGAVVARNLSRMEAAMHGIVFRKLASVELSALPRLELTQLRSALAIDLERLFFCIVTFHTGPVGIASLLYGGAKIWERLGARGLLAFALFSLTGVATFLIGLLLLSLFARKLALADARAKTLEGMLAGMKAIKLGGWEEALGTLIVQRRRSEQSIIKKVTILRSTIDALFIVFPMLSLLFYTFRLSSSKSDFGGLRAALGVMTIMAMPVRQLVYCVLNFLDVRQTLTRIDAFLGVSDAAAERPSPLPSGEVRLSAATIAFRGAAGSAVALESVSLSVRPGELVAVVGALGAGKSALLEGLAGGAAVVAGENGVGGALAYVPAESFLLNDSLRNNVLFGRPIDEERYGAVLADCQLLTDVAALPAGDATVIGERGATFSGGQRQRVAVARAVYANADVYLFDDCLSALDAHVGAALFERVFKGALSGKTIIAATNALHLLPQFDRVIFLENGRVRADGTYAELVQSEDFRAFIGEKSAALCAPAIAPSAVAESGAPTTLMRAEKRATGFVGPSVYLKHFGGGGKALCATTIALVAALAAIQIAGERLIVGYSEGGAGKLSTRAFRNRHAIICFLGVLVAAARAICYAELIGRIGYRTFDALLRTMLRTTVCFFDTTPTGQLVNLTTKDADTVDLALPSWTLFSLSQLTRIAGVVLMAIWASAWTTPLFVAFMLSLGFLARTVLRCSVELRRLSQLSTSRLLSIIGELHNGLKTFRIHENVDWQWRKYAREAEVFISARMHERRAFFFGVFLAEVLCGIAVGGMLLTLGATRTFATSLSAERLASVVGAIMRLISVVNVLPFTFASVSGALAAMSSTQRMVANIGEEETEAIADGDSARSDWPTAGAVKVDGLRLRYRPNLPFALDGVSFEANGGEKVGIVGRTGGGKSSLLLAITRIVEAEEGSITIDGVDVRQIALGVLRRRVVTIPQEPFFFAGSVRENLDPANKHSAEELISALRKSFFLETQFLAESKNSETIDFDERERALERRIEAGGANLSAGERQLLSFARALLARPRVLLMDEATANVDPATEERVRRMVASEFGEVTVISIAHRLHTLSNYDRLVIIADGKAVESGAPKDLLASSSLLSEVIGENRTN